METSGKHLNNNQRSFSEKDIMAEARDVFGVIPAWYRENKGIIEKTRLESEEKNLEFSRELQWQLRNLREILSKPALAKKSKLDK